MVEQWEGTSEAASNCCLMYELASEKGKQHCVTVIAAITINHN